ncbi:3,4-dihydroxyphenylacetaldehyde synthase 2 isoform X1 [Stomoxys calcitrans]|uniref:3,4-dihydroxyphenylacetaldehyde synthase 2 isoform X1 n=1 Tax=Stomoxys calcitrans TaxID=35570 RepID=UPI0027E35244|nr:3,4-dihydroxyphenylacetaldehyde synthase 2 isoform X1 [Stomoxys calcitrans]
MDAKTFREFGKAAVDYVADYMENIRDCDILPSVKPGYLFDLLPKDMPETSEDWRDILEDVDRIIKPGITHWQSPNMHAFYPTASSFPAMVGDMLCNAFSVIGFSWIASPACTELEVVVMDWLAKFLKLPEEFLHSHEGPGGGIIQGSASESILVALMAAREQAVKHWKQKHPEMSESDIRGKLVSYSSDQSNSCVEKAGVLGAVTMRLLPANDEFILTGEILEKAVLKDLEQGLIPLICIATLGTTGTCAYDDIPSLGAVCQKYNIWLHVDAAYAGSAFALEEFSHLRNGLELVESLNFNMHKFLMVNFDCAGMWLKDANKVVDSFNVDPIYLKHKYEGQNKMPDFRHWQIPLGRRFRALKVWVTFRTIGAEGLRAYIRKHIDLAKRFENFVLSDSRFEMVANRSLGLVCFRPKGDNLRTTELLNQLTERKQIYLIQAKRGNLHFLRFCICGMDPQEEDVDFAWKEIQSQLDVVLKTEFLNAVKNDVDIISQKFSKDVYINGTAPISEKSK